MLVINPFVSLLLPSVSVNRDIKLGERENKNRVQELCGIEQGSPTPGPRTGSGPRPVRNWAAQQEVSGGQAREASSAAPHRSPSLALPPEPSPPPHPPVSRKIVLHETGPWCQKDWGPLV